ncbi:MAG: hypothetical protein ACYSUI_07395 [Planctomycetota bacterium]
MNPATESHRVGLTFALMMSLALCGCATSTGGGGGGEDPLPGFQLGQDEDLDADVAAITAADNDALECLGEVFVFSQEDTLLTLKQGYVGSDTSNTTFPEFVANIVPLERAKAEEICETTLENASDELQADIGQLTAARNRARECQGEAPDLTDENSLELLKTAFLAESVLRSPTLLDFAELFVNDIERIADQECGG